MRPLSLSLLCLGLLAPSLANAEGVDFERDIQPILATHCYDCHGPDSQEGQLRLDARQAAFAGGVSGASIKPGQPDNSPLVQRLHGGGDLPRMPLDLDPLSDQQIEQVEKWIAEGARWPAGVGAEVEERKQHWAYASPVRSAMPSTDSGDWVRNVVDAFTLPVMKQHGLNPSPVATESTLVRRVYLDLLGLPPTVAEVEAYLQEDRPGKYERLVERLLASPRYGVRWARPWLDAARYADSNGYQADQFRSVWPYRDWVINALNQDMSFAQFTLEQIAGDLLPDATVDQRIASGFHRLTTCNVEAGVDPEENRVNQIIDRVNTTGTVWLGTTIECAQCHNHKYDPFSQRDYYQLFAYFNNTPLEVEGNGVTYNFVGPKMELPFAPAQLQVKKEIEAKLETLQAARERRADDLLTRLPEWEADLNISSADLPEWHLLQVESFRSEGGASHAAQEDGSILVSGKKPSKDTYLVVTKGIAGPITGFRLEALTDPSLPGNGPGRYERPNFVLHEFEVSCGPEEEKSRKVALGRATADFSQTRYDVAGAIDGDLATAWAINPQFGKPHQASFLTDEPLEVGPNDRLHFRLIQNYGGGRTIGRLRLSAMTGDPGNDLPEAILQILVREQSKRTKEQNQQLRKYYLEADSKLRQIDRQIAAEQKKFDSLRKQTTLVMVEMPEGRETHVLRRGSFLNPGESVGRGTPRILPQEATAKDSDRRELARWLTSDSNPLTARVIVNRAWGQIFGRGIVATVEDFGTQGEVPTHPRLLDWLAVEFVEKGWSLKHIHRLIVSSATYQQSSRVDETVLRADPQNLYLAHAPRLRLPAEMIRDNALAISGLLCEDMGGPPVYPPQPENVWRHVGRNAPKYATDDDGDRFRRGIYVFWRRSAPYPSFVNFDAPDRASCVVQRSRTNTPLQALTLMNDPAYVEMALGLAKRVLREKSKAELSTQLEYAWQLCTGRRPHSDELAHLLGVLKAERDFYRQQTSLAVKLVGEPDAGHDPLTLAAWFHVCNILLNLDETICKN